jgi:uncharacterized protein YuzE
LSTFGDLEYTISYDPEYDVLKIRVNAAGRAVIGTEIRPNIFVHKDETGKVAGFTLLHYREQLGGEPVVMKTTTLPGKFRELVPA